MSISNTDVRKRSAAAENGSPRLTDAEAERIASVLNKHCYDRQPPVHQISGTPNSP
jgi:hypothetical protein